MDQKELKARIDSIRTIAVQQIAKAAQAKPDPEAEVIAGLMLIGLDLVGDLLLDIKRIADAVEANAFVDGK